MMHTGSTATAAAPPPPWRAPLLWRFVLRLSTVLVPLVCRLRVTTSEQFDELVSRTSEQFDELVNRTGRQGDAPVGRPGGPGDRRPRRPGRGGKRWRVRGPLILAGNHIANFDPVATTAACARLGIAPRMMATGGLFRVPIVGAFMRAAGHIPVERGQETVVNAVPDAAAALAAGSVVFIYPEGRIGLHPALWPERPRTGIARFALTTRAPVVPVAIWGSHEVIAYHGWPVMIRMLISALWRRPVVRVHFGDPVDLSDLRAGAVGHAQRAAERIMDAITADLARLRSDEPGLPRFRDHTRPVTLARARHRKA
jgi:1-acyl-sn-glycerol-3-phosphate acyltransferase